MFSLDIFVSSSLICAEFIVPLCNFFFINMNGLINDFVVDTVEDEKDLPSKFIVDMFKIQCLFILARCSVSLMKIWLSFYTGTVFTDFN